MELPPIYQTCQTIIYFIWFVKFLLFFVCFMFLISLATSFHVFIFLSCQLALLSCFNELHKYCNWQTQIERERVLFHLVSLFHVIFYLLNTLQDHRSFSQGRMGFTLALRKWLGTGFVSSSFRLAVAIMTTTITFND